MRSDLWPRVPPLWRERLEALGVLLGKKHLPAALVGGCVRDLLLNRAPKDWDVVVEGAPGPVVKAFAQTQGAQVKEHPRFLTYALHYPGGDILDVATARTETYAAPGALPTVRAAALAADAARRDFSANALYLRLSPERGQIWDPLAGGKDLAEGVLRVLHEKSFDDDPTRLYRAARYAGRFGWTVEGKTESWIRRAVADDRPAALSLVRRRNELFHILEEDDPGPALSLLRGWDLWKYWSPAWPWSPAAAARLTAARGLSQRLAAFFAGDAAAAEAWLKSVSAPTALRAEVARHPPRR